MPGTEVHDDKSQSANTVQHQHCAPPRPKSPYPRPAPKTNSHEDNTKCSKAASLGEAKLAVENRFQTPLSHSSNNTSVNTSGSSRLPSIRWDKNLPVPDRKVPAFPIGNNPSFGPELQRAQVSHNKHELHSEPCPQSPRHDNFTTKRQEHEVEELNFKNKSKVIETQSQQRKISTTSQSSQNSNINMAYAGSLRHHASFGRPVAPITRAYNEEADIQKHTRTFFGIESDTESSGDCQDGSPNSLTFQVLKDLPERQGATNKTKKSHPSWDISDGDSDNSSDGHYSSRSGYNTGKEGKPTLSVAVSSWLAGWLQNLPSQATVSSFWYDNSWDHWNSSIDPETGELMEAVVQPDTYVDHEKERMMDPKMIQRRQNWTSNLIIRREITVRQNLRRLQKQKMEEEERFSPVVKMTPQPADMSSSAIANSGALDSAASKRQLLHECTLRPGLLSDIEGCVDIYNMAAASHSPLADTKPVSYQQFESIFSACSKERLPFVVAAMQRADLTDAKNWPSLDAYRQYMKWKQAQPQEDEPSEAIIYGFAFLTPYETGLALGAGAATETVKATIFVHPEHRRNGVGSALLHRLLTQTSILFHGDVHYDWKDPSAAQDSFYRPDFRPIHREFLRGLDYKLANPGVYAGIVIHGMVNGESEELKWMDNFLKVFQFEKAGHLSQVYKVVKPHGVDWYDQAIWVHWANKIDVSRTFYVGDESECSYDYPGKARSPVLRRVHPYQV
ncbi:acyl-n-acyltransferase [Colletotrichum truncatum]|uniref:Acyl-n-acyltransferase n=1 Tax=Colletotrichum truncatum TaxID=5467 RepID=A0ACC3YJP5_COLTU|nr:acyl-n-acyltransferase [Colletotrichum truncatum]KAF6797307.1 acyl-n-acyltransferase [Colletotrichum truncatum]